VEFGIPPVGLELGQGEEGRELVPVDEPVGRLRLEQVGHHPAQGLSRPDLIAARLQGDGFGEDLAHFQMGSDPVAVGSFLEGDVGHGVELTLDLRRVR
jgi:hypothetical protein